MDIQGIEDFFWRHGLEVAGTKDGITAIQVDIKVDGLTYEIIEQAFELTRNLRLHILDDVILKIQNKKGYTRVCPENIFHIHKSDKIRDVIGPSGKV